MGSEMIREARSEAGSAISRGLEISVVIPVLNEEGSLADLYREVTDVLQAFGRSYEILFVDDGSTDASYAILASLHSGDSRVQVIRLRRNFGQTAALAAGFDHASGNIVVTLDGDRQNDPTDIPALVRRLEQGFDMVCGWRKDRKDPFFSRRLPSQIANRLISITTGVHLHDYGCTLKAMRSEVAKNIQLYGEMHRFIPAVASWMGVDIDEMVVSHRPRQQGKSKYGIHAYAARAPRSADREVSPELLQPAAADFWLVWVLAGRHGFRHWLLLDLGEVRAGRADRWASAPTARYLADVRRSAAGESRSSRGVAGASLPRNALAARLRGSRSALRRCRFRDNLTI